MRPTAFLGHAEEAGPWSSRDRELARALLIYEGQTCDGCGQPAHESQDPDRLGWYDIERVICVACAAIAEASDKPEPGLRFRVKANPNYVRRT